MAERRMFAKTIIDSDAFLDMPLTTQALYFHLSMRADDDGFLNNAQKIIRMIGASRNDYELLLVKRFIIQFEDGICVIKHWRIHNYIRSDRYKPTMYKDKMERLDIDINKAYEIRENNALINEKNKVVNEENHIGIPNDNQMDTQVRLVKDRIDKDRTGKNSKEKHEVTKDNPNREKNKDSLCKSNECKIKEKKYEICNEDRDICQQRKFYIDKESDYYDKSREKDNNSTITFDSGDKNAIEVHKNKKPAYSTIISDKELTEIIVRWNSLNVKRIINIKNNRLKTLNARIKEFGIDKLFEAIGNIDRSDFLKGNNKRGWMITFDWFIKQGNFTKVIEGNYLDNSKGEDFKHDKGPLNNFDARNYDYNSLEKKLLGWDKDETEHMED